MKFEVDHLDQLDDVAKTLVALQGVANVFAFYGPMGAGKTTLIKYLCRRLGVEEEVSSPTFSIVNEYVTVDNEVVYHFDFYRINKIEEAYDIGYENYFFSPYLCLVEWPEKVEQLLPKAFVKVNIVMASDSETRWIEIETVP